MLIVSGFEAALTAADETDDVGEIFVIGGATIYTLALMSPRCQVTQLIFLSLFLSLSPTLVLSLHAYTQVARVDYEVLVCACGR